MPIVGSSDYLYAKRTYDETLSKATYAGGAIFMRARSIKEEAEFADSSPYYADNMIAENGGGGFTGGKITLKGSELEPGVAKTLLNLKEVNETVSGKPVTVLEYSGQTPSEIGITVVNKYVIKGKIKWQGVFYPRVQPKAPSLEANTQEDSYDYQDTEIELLLMADQGTRKYKRTTDWIEDDAGYATCIAWCKQQLEITA